MASTKHIKTIIIPFFFGCSVFEQEHYLGTHKNTWNRSILRMRFSRAYRTLKTLMNGARNVKKQTWWSIKRVTSRSSDLRNTTSLDSRHWTIGNDCQLIVKIAKIEFLSLYVHTFSQALHLPPKWSNGVCIGSMVNIVKNVICFGLEIKHLKVAYAMRCQQLTNLLELTEPIVMKVSLKNKHWN